VVLRKAAIIKLAKWNGATEIHTKGTGKRAECREEVFSDTTMDSS